MAPVVGPATTTQAGPIPGATARVLVSVNKHKLDSASPKASAIRSVFGTTDSERDIRPFVILGAQEWLPARFKPAQGEALAKEATLMSVVFRRLTSFARAERKMVADIKSNGNFEREINRGVQGQIKNIAAEYQRMLGGIVRTYAGRPAATIKPILRRNWQKIGGDMTDPELAEYTRHISNGTRIQVKL